jgi:hypothetical protein
MNVEKVESLLLRVINKEFPFVKKVKFGTDRGGDSIFTMYVNLIELRDKYKLRIDREYLQDQDGGPFMFLDYMFNTTNNESFYLLCGQLEELANTLILPFAEQYGTKQYGETENVITTMYDFTNYRL